MFIENNLFIYVLFFEKLNVISLCWIGELVDFNFIIYYCLRKVSMGVDVLFWMFFVDIVYIEIVL